VRAKSFVEDCLAMHVVYGNVMHFNKKCCQIVMAMGCVLSNTVYLKFILLEGRTIILPFIYPDINKEASLTYSLFMTLMLQVLHCKLVACHICIMRFVLPNLVSVALKLNRFHVSTSSFSQLKYGR
jgi:hypothetical protein